MSRHRPRSAQSVAGVTFVVALASALFVVPIASHAQAEDVVQCIVGCVVDADCPGDIICDKDPVEPQQDACFQHGGVCVRKCRMPRCLANRCVMAGPPATVPTAPYIACEEQDGCDPPRCGDGVVQGPPAPPASNNETCTASLSTCAATPGAAECHLGQCLGTDGRPVLPMPGGAPCSCLDGNGNPPTPPPVEIGDEECDDGNVDPDDGCGATCKKEVCGDGVVQFKGTDGLPNTADDETCDDGNLVGNDGCGPTCIVEVCGDGIKGMYEECDDGPNNSDTEPGACRMDCTFPRCGDDIVDAVAPYNEECDCGDWTDGARCPSVRNGEPSLCMVGLCQHLFCGDGVAFTAGADLQSGTPDDEVCDDGPWNSDLPVGSDQCDNDSQCASGICVDNECLEDKPCSSNADCPSGACINDVCTPGGCTNDGQCPFTANSGNNANQCLSGSCKYCDSNDDCATGFCMLAMRSIGMCAHRVAGIAYPPETTCRLDCKPVRCGDGIIDEGAGETCDEGPGMFKCSDPPFEQCDCGIPSGGSATGPWDTTCCGDGQQCRLEGSSTCPRDCGVGAGRCGNGRIESGEDCDVSNSTLGLFILRPNRDGTQTSFVADDGRWFAFPTTIEEKYTTIDHPPATVSPDDAWIRSAPAGVSLTYFHLWDIPEPPGSLVLGALVRVGVDFTGQGTNWRVQEVGLSLDPTPRTIVSVADINAAILVVKGDADNHTLQFALYHSVTGRQLTLTGTIVSTATYLQAPMRIDVDAIEVEVSIGNTGASTCSSCSIPRCGNYVVDSAIGEQCDDGNADAGDGCDDRCAPEICALPVP